MARILITCVGSGVGQSAVDSLNMAGEDYIIGCDMNRDIYATHFCHEFFKLPSMYSDGYVDYLIAFAKKHQVDLIIPGHDHELLILSKEKQKFIDNGIAVLVSEPSIIEISRDKYLWFKHFNDLGCNIVTTYKVSAFKENPDSSIFPAIIKPAGGSASQGIKIVHNVEEIGEANPDDIIQPYLMPPRSDSNYQMIANAVEQRRFVQLSEISIQLIFNNQSQYVGIFISKNSLKNGIPVTVDTILPENFPYLSDILKFVPILEQAGVKGPVNIQGRITEKGLSFFEMNMRFTGITGNRAHLGFNEVKYLVDDFLGKPVSPLMYSDNQMGVRQVACTAIEKSERGSNKVYTVLGGGFIGCQFIDSLLDKEGLSINLVCRASSLEKYKQLYQGMPVKVIPENDSNIQNIYCMSDVVLNCIGALAYNEDSVIYEAIQFQHKQVEKLAKADVPVIVNLSSQSVYDQTRNTSKQEDSAHILIDNAYALQKKLGEEMFTSIGKKYPFSRVISLRLPRVTGQGKSGVNGFFKKIITSVRQEEAINIPYPMNNTTLINVKDVVGAVHFVIDNDLPKIDVINVGGVDVSMKDYCMAVEQYLNMKNSGLIDYGASEEVTQSSLVCGERLLTFGWKPAVDLNQLIKEIDLCK